MTLLRSMSKTSPAAPIQEFHLGVIGVAILGVLALTCASGLTVVFGGDLAELLTSTTEATKFLTVGLATLLPAATVASLLLLFNHAAKMDRPWRWIAAAVVATVVNLALLAASVTVLVALQLWLLGTPGNQLVAATVYEIAGTHVGMALAACLVVACWVAGWVRALGAWMWVNSKVIFTHR